MDQWINGPHWILSIVPISNFQCSKKALRAFLVEAGGIEPPSEGHLSAMTTCLAVNLISLFEPPTAGFLKLSGLDFGLSPSGRGIGLSH